MKKKFLLRFRLFYKFLLSYAVLLAVPLIFFAFMINNAYLTILKDEVLAKNTNLLTQVRDDIDSQMSELWTISLNISYNPEMHKYFQNQDPIYGMEIVRHVSNYSFSNNFAEEMFIYFRGGPYIYSAAGSYTLDNFAKNFFAHEDWSEDEIFNDLNTIEYPVVRLVSEAKPINVKDRYIKYMLPITPNLINQYATVVFLINEKTIQKMFANIVQGSTSNVIIFNEDNRIIASLNTADYIKSDAFNQILEHSETMDTDEVNLDGVKYYISSIYSEKMDWKYVIVKPVDEILAKPTLLRNRAMGGVLILFLFGSVFIYLVMQINYKPIKKLKSFAEEKLGHSLSTNNEIDSVRGAIEQMSQKASDLNERLDNSHEAIKENLVINLLKGQIQSVEEFNTRGKETAVSFTHNSYFTAIIYAKELNEQEKKKMIDATEKFFTNDFEAYGIESFNTDSLIFVFSTTQTDQTDWMQMESMFTTLQIALMEMWKIDVTIGIGNLYSNITDICKSYIEATTAVDYRLIMGKNRAIMYNEIFKYQHNNYYYSKGQMDQLDLFIVKGNAEKVQEILGRLMLFIYKNNISLFMVRSICFDIINTVMKAVGLANREYESTLPYPDATMLTQFDTVDELVEIVQIISRDIYENIKEKNARKNNQIGRIISYIESNYLDHNYSIQNMADHFQMSLSNISHYFKEQTGENISEYINELRMKEAKKLLAETNQALQDIVEGIGYTNVSSFIRKFKQTTGMTPGEYRVIVKSHVVGDGWHS